MTYHKYAAILLSETGEYCLGLPLCCCPEVGREEYRDMIGLMLDDETERTWLIKCSENQASVIERR